MVLHPLLLLLHPLPLPLRSLTHSRSLLLAVLFWGGSQSVAFEAAGLHRTLLHLLQCDRVKKTYAVQDPDCSQERAWGRLPDGVQTQRESYSLLASHINQRDEQGQSEVITWNINGRILRVAFTGKPSHQEPPPICGGQRSDNPDFIWMLPLVFLQYWLWQG